MLKKKQKQQKRNKKEKKLPQVICGGFLHIIN